MKAEINELGTLIISSETPLESYAIHSWVNENWKGCAREIKTDNLQFDWNVPKDDKKDEK